jgi:hypothetical protein
MPSSKESGSQPGTDPLSDSRKDAEVPGASWETLRGLTDGAQKQRRSTNVRIVAFALLLILTFSFLGWLLHIHLPALVDFGEHVNKAVSTFMANAPKPSPPKQRSDGLSARSTHKKHQSSRVRSYPDRAETTSDDAYEPLFHPFGAMAIIDGRRIPLVPHNRIIIVDLVNGTWKVGSESE